MVALWYRSNLILITIIPSCITNMYNFVSHTKKLSPIHCNDSTPCKTCWTSPPHTHYGLSLGTGRPSQPCDRQSFTLRQATRCYGDKSSILPLLIGSLLLEFNFMLALGMPQQFRMVILHRMVQMIKRERGMFEFVGFNGNVLSNFCEQRITEWK